MLDFENAAVWRNKIRALSNIQSFQNININGLGDADIIAVFSNFKKTALFPGNKPAELLLRLLKKHIK